MLVVVGGGGARHHHNKCLMMGLSLQFGTTNTENIGGILLKSPATWSRIFFKGDFVKNLFTKYSSWRLEES